MNLIMKAFSGAFIFLMLSASLFAQEVIKPQLVPWPTEISFNEGHYVPKNKIELVSVGNQKEVKSLIETFTNDLTYHGYMVSNSQQMTGSDESYIFLNLTDDGTLKEEAYNLKVDADITISANSVTGLFWGTRTVLQLLSGGAGAAVTKLAIEDQPKLEYRGLLIDNARSIHSLEFHLKTIKQLASYKMNRYQIHFSDKESYTLPSDKFPDLPTKGRHFSKEDVRQIQELAKEYHVEIVPEIDVPGHSRALTAGIPELNCTDVKGDAVKLCIGKASTYTILKELFSEITEMFPGEYWHLGADEVRYPDLEASECTACKKRMEELNLTTGLELYHFFINEMYAFVKKEKRQMLVWEGFDPAAKPLIDKEIIVCPFDIKHEGRMPDDYMNKGYRILNTSWTPLYIADKLYMTTPEIIARWTPYMFGAGRSPNPFAYWEKYAETPLVIGAQMCSWANEEKVEEGLIFGTGPGFSDYGRPAPRLQIVAERIWTGSATSYTDLLTRVGEAYWD
jgi:hexosaminidase